MIKERNRTLDIARGIACLMVLASHTISVNTVNYENTPFFRLLWSLQLPLFMLTSGLVTAYSAPPNTAKELLLFIKKRTIAYLVPLFSWVIIEESIIMSKKGFFETLNYLKYLVWHMDVTYWFLFSLWTLCMVYGISCFLSSFVFKKTVSHTVGLLLFSGVFLLALFVLMLSVGFNFLCLKLTLYYSCFYYCGFLFSKIYPLVKDKRLYRKAETAVVFICAIVYLYMIINFDLWSAGDTIGGIIVRLVSSFSGCVLTFKIVNQLAASGPQNAFIKQLDIIGRQSLGFFMIQYWFLQSIAVEKTAFLSPYGFLTFVLIFVIALLGCKFVIYILRTNKILSFLFLGEYKKRKNNPGENL